MNEDGENRSNENFHPFDNMVYLIQAGEQQRKTLSDRTGNSSTWPTVSVPLAQCGYDNSTAPSARPVVVPYGGVTLGASGALSQPAVPQQFKSVFTGAGQQPDSTPSKTTTYTATNVFDARSVNVHDLAVAVSVETPTVARKVKRTLEAETQDCVENTAEDHANKKARAPSSRMTFDKKLFELCETHPEVLTLLKPMSNELKAVLVRLHKLSRGGSLDQLHVFRIHNEPEMLKLMNLQDRRSLARTFRKWGLRAVPGKYIDYYIFSPTLKLTYERGNGGVRSMPAHNIPLDGKHRARELANDEDKSCSNNRADQTLTTATAANEMDTSKATNTQVVKVDRETMTIDRETMTTGADDESDGGICITSGGVCSYAVNPVCEHNATDFVGQETKFGVVRPRFTVEETNVLDLRHAAA